MKTTITTTLLSLWAFISFAQDYPYEVSKEFPFGRPNSDAPSQIKDFEPMIGRCDCKSVTRVDQNTWADTVDMVWTFKYIMNGTAVQDEVLRPNGLYAGSLRQYHVDSASWYVHYYSNVVVPTLPAWGGNREDGKIILYREQKSPNGLDGFYKITFSDFTDTGYNWLGEWVNTDETFHYPTWRIFCKKVR
jgi:hypothetical protein